jgi:hypothetical protein
MRKNTFKNNFTCEMKVNSLMDGKKQKKKNTLMKKNSYQFLIVIQHF